MWIDQTLVKQRTYSLYRFLLIVGIVLVSFNLRPGITSVGPLFSLIQGDLGLANWSVGLLTSLPLLAFAAMSPIAPTLGEKLTNERAILVGLIVLGIGMSIRSISFIVFLFAGTILVGLGIAICNVLLPGFIKDKFSLKVALMTGVYSTVMNIFAAAASGLSIPLASGLHWGWQRSLLFWMIPVVLAIILWIYLDRKNQKDQKGIEIKYMAPSRKGKMWRSPLAWQVALFMGLQSTLFYVTISWLPEILVVNSGLSPATAGWVLSFIQFIGLPGSFIVPIIAGKLKSQRILVVVLAMCMITGFTGLLLGSSFPVIMLSTSFIGLALSGNFALALTFLGLRARTAVEAAQLSGMAQAIGYLLAALGPVTVGLLYDVTHAWTIPIMTLIGVSIFMLGFGLYAGRNRYVLN